MYIYIYINKKIQMKRESWREFKEQTREKTIP